MIKDVLSEVQGDIVSADDGDGKNTTDVLENVHIHGA